MCRSNAGKFVTANGIIDVEVNIVTSSTQSTQMAAGAKYLLITVSNTRDSSCIISNGDALFVPFKSRRKRSASDASSASTCASAVPCHC